MERGKTTNAEKLNSIRMPKTEERESARGAEIIQSTDGGTVKGGRLRERGRQKNDAACDSRPVRSSEFGVNAS